MNWQELLADTVQKFTAANMDMPGFQAKQICYEASGFDADNWHEVSTQDVTQRHVAKVDEMIGRRLQGEPLQYVLGGWGFRYLDLLVDSRVLIPRPETEEVVGWALEKIADVASPVVVDLGTGSGAIGLSVATEVPAATVTMTDLEPAALEVARANLAGLGVAGSMVTIVESDWFHGLDQGLAGEIDLLISNPPYGGSVEEFGLEVSTWEPSSAYLSGESGYEDLEHIVNGAPSWLKPGGWLVLEMAPWQTDRIASACESAGLASVEVKTDLSEHPRCVLGQLPKPSDK